MSLELKEYVGSKPKEVKEVKTQTKRTDNKNTKANTTKKSK